MRLSGMQTPDRNTINIFRLSRLKDRINQLFTRVVLLPVDTGCLSLDAAYIDGKKIESRADRCAFIRRKTVEKNKAGLEAEIRQIPERIDEGIIP
jgi:transposase